MAELVNKINGPWFSKFDEDLATAFSIYCGISIAHVRERDSGREGGLRLPTLCSGLSIHTQHESWLYCFQSCPHSF